MYLKKLILIVWFFSIIACQHRGNSQSIKNETVKKPLYIEYEYLNSFPHDTTAFTEGLLVHNGNLYESTGATKDFPQTRSLFGIVNMETGNIKIKAEIDKNKYFGEGIAFLDGKVFQLTYKNKIAFAYETVHFKKINEYPLPSEEGWGLTTDGRNLIMSDGTSNLYYIDPQNFKVIKTIVVTEKGNPKKYINELEYINGFIYANIWTTNIIAKIDTANGKILATMDLSFLAEEANSLYYQSQEMNGIAYDPSKDLVYVTGKLWPKTYVLRIK